MHHFSILSIDSYLLLYFVRLCICSWECLGQFLMGSLLLFPGSWCTQGFVCVLQESVSSVLFRFWWFYGRVNGNLLQEGLCHTQACCTQSPCIRPLLTRASTGGTQTPFWLSLCGLGVRFVPFPGVSSSDDQCLESVLSQKGRVSESPPQSWPLGFPGAMRKHRLRCAIRLLRRPDLRLRLSWWMSTIQDLRKMSLAARSLLTVLWKMPSLRLRL